MKDTGADAKAGLRALGRRLFSWLAVMAVGAFLCGVPADAQTVDPAILRQLQRAQAEQGPLHQPSPVDQAREESLREPMMRDAAAATFTRAAPYPEPLSRLELDYQKRTGQEIRQYGYDLFASPAQPSTGMVGRIADDYVLGVGDEVVLILHGSTERAVTTAVDREGRIIVEGLPPITAAGRTFGEVRDEIEARTSKAFIGTEAFVSLGGLRQLSVYVVGEVKRPGLYRLTSLSTALDALTAAGGVNRSGSLRKIKIVTGSQTRILDLYRLMDGQGGDLRLSDGARIVVPVIGGTAAVYGEVLRPGIYELPTEGNSAKELLAFAGGTIRPTGYAYVLTRVGAEGHQQVETLANLNGRVADGDIYNVGLRRDVWVGAVELLGHVRAPGIRSIGESPTLSALLGDVETFKDYPYLLFGAIETTDPVSRARVLEPFSPEKVLFGGADRKLRDKDRVILFGRSDIDFLSASSTRRVVLTGSYTPTPMPGEKVAQRCMPLDELARLVGDTRSERYATAVRAVFSQLDVTKVEEAADIEAARQQREAAQISAEARIDSNGRKVVTRDEFGAREMDVQGKTQAPDQNQDDPMCPKVYRAVANLLPFTLEYVASADGAVRTPGVYPLAEATSVGSLIAAAGGATFGADYGTIEVQSSTANGTPGMRQRVDGRATDLATVTIGPAGGIRLNTVYRAEEGGAVLLSGEFKHPGVYSIKRGEKLSELIERAGGLSDQAYPYGAVFTRNRVKEAQQAGLQRTARELNAGLATAALKNREMSADVLMAAQKLAESIATVDMVGRVVIEADPRVLAERPDLDTTLEGGDEIHIPKRPNYVLLIGDVLNPGALQFVAGKSVKAYLREGGGIQSTADDDRIFVVYPNGAAKPVKLSSWGFNTGVMVPPGTAIVVPKDVQPIDTLNLVKDISTIIGQLAVSAASIAVISR